MNRKIYFWMVIALIAMLLPGSAFAGAKSIALTLKVTGNVQITKAGSSTKAPLKFGTPLDDGDRISTGADGAATLIFADDKSRLQLKPGTEVTIGGKRDKESNIAKRITMDVGELYAKVTRQRGTLEIVTPTSVASVKGTEFVVGVSGSGETIVVTFEGLVQLVNSISGQTSEVGEGQRGISGPDGELTLDIPTSEEYENLQPSEQDEILPGTIEVEVEEADGVRKTILIQYIEEAE